MDAMKPAIRKITADTLVTGGTGFLGRWLVAALTGEGRNVVVLARGGVKRQPELASFVDAHKGDSRKLHVIEGDLTVDGLGIDCDVRGIRDVYHLAAVFAFRMHAAYAHQINTQGTLRVAKWAKAQPELRRIIHLGGYRTTKVPDWLTDTSYPLRPEDKKRLYRSHGAYEASKYESYFAMKQYCKQENIPYTAVHPSSVIGSSLTGESSQLTGIGEFVQKLWERKLPALAGTAQTNLPLVSVDYLSRFLISIPENDDTAGQDLVVLDTDTPRLPALVEEFSDHLGVPAPTRLLSTRLLACIPKALSGIEPESLSFLTEDDYDTLSAQAHAESAKLASPDRKPATALWLDHLISTDFGKSPEADPGHFVQADDSRTFVVGDLENASTLFLHGLPWDGHSFRELAKLMAAPSARPDLPGLGRSSQCSTSDVNWLLELVETAGAPVLLVCHSYSTDIGLRVAKERPDLVSGLVLISPFFLQSRAPWFLRNISLSRRLLRLGTVEALQKRLLKKPPTEGIHSAVASAYRHLLRKGVAKRTAQIMAEVSRVEYRQELHSILSSVSVPTLLVHGQLDPLETNTIAPAVSISDAGHSPHVDSPKLVANAIEGWRRSVL